MIIRREALQAVLPATTADDTRYFLHAIRCEPAANRVVATNGHVLLIATDTEPFQDADFPIVPGAEFHGNPAEPVSVPVDVIKAMIATMPKRTTLPILGCAQVGRNGSESSIVVSATDLQAPRVANVQIEESKRFPDYSRVLPKPERESVEVVLGVEVLETLIKAAKAIGTTGARGRVPAIRLKVPTGRSDRDIVTTTDPDTKEEIETLGYCMSALDVRIVGPDVTVTGAAMPMRP